MSNTTRSKNHAGTDDALKEEDTTENVIEEIANEVNVDADIAVHEDSEDNVHEDIAVTIEDKVNTQSQRWRIEYRRNIKKAA